MIQTKNYPIRSDFYPLKVLKSRNRIESNRRVSACGVDESMNPNDISSIKGFGVGLDGRGARRDSFM